MTNSICNVLTIVMRGLDPCNNRKYYLSSSSNYKIDARGYIVDEFGGIMQCWGWFNNLRDIRLSGTSQYRIEVHYDRKLFLGHTYSGFKVATQQPRSILGFFYRFVSPPIKNDLIPLLALDGEDTIYEVNSFNLSNP